MPAQIAPPRRWCRSVAALALALWSGSWLWIALSRWRYERMANWVSGPYLPGAESRHVLQSPDWRTPLAVAALSVLLSVLLSLAAGAVAARVAGRRRGTVRAG